MQTLPPADIAGQNDTPTCVVAACGHPPKPVPRPDRVSFWRYMTYFRRDMLSAHPERLYRARMAEFRTPFFCSFMVNQPDLIRRVLTERPDDFPKSDRIREGLLPLLGNSVFLTNGAAWKRQRRIIDPAFEGGRLRETFPAVRAATEAAVNRLARLADNSPVEIEAETSHAAADIIFRMLFSLPIEDAFAAQVYAAFRAYQRSQPLVNVAALLPLPRWIPRIHSRATRRKARTIRKLIAQLTEARAAQIAAGTAPDDLATKIMTTPDPLDGTCFDAAEMVDHVAIFFLAGHEASASSMAWALYLLATHPDVQDRVAEEARTAFGPDGLAFSQISKLRFTRDVYREAMRLYPPVPMMVREATRPERFRDRDVPPGSQIVVSPWHLHRQPRLWERPDDFDPDRWHTEAGRRCMRDAFIPFSIGPRVCPGAGLAMIEGPLLLAMMARRFVIRPVDGRKPVPVAYLTVRAKDGIWLRLEPR